MESSRGHRLLQSAAKALQLFSPEEKQRLFDNTARAIKGASQPVVQRHIDNCTAYDAGVAEAIARLGRRVESRAFWSCGLFTSPIVGGTRSFAHAHGVKASSGCGSASPMSSMQASLSSAPWRMCSATTAT
ncbi:catalase-related domain-containing protein [Luteibacter sp. W1I16]|uniref:catalase-related domain-containing protein n=1 Tax=Luteibacter sp. W1I16 TaxID=3373922 RepID=UPI003D226842